MPSSSIAGARVTRAELSRRLVELRQILATADRFFEGLFHV